MLHWYKSDCSVWTHIRAASVKLGKDIINLNITVLPSGLTLEHQARWFWPNQQHAMDLSIQGADDFGDWYGAACRIFISILNL